MIKDKTPRIELKSNNEKKKFKGKKKSEYKIKLKENGR